MHSDCKILDYGITLQIFDLCVVEIDKEIQDQISFYLDIDGYLYLETQPNIVYVS